MTTEQLHAVIEETKELREATFQLSDCLAKIQEPFKRLKKQPTPEQLAECRRRAGITYNLAVELNKAVVELV